MTAVALGPLALDAIAGAASTVLFAASGAALYHELRHLKDGGGAGALAAVFD